MKTVILFALALLLGNSFCNSAVLSKAKQWPKGSKLNIVFLDGKTEHHELVKQIAPQWIEGTSLTFKFFSKPSQAPKQTHIRVSFKLLNGSRLGDHQDYESTLPTMNLFGITLNNRSLKTKTRLILHEFGHALGLEHEYRSRYWPYGSEPIDKLINDCFPQMKLSGHNEHEAREKCLQVNAPLTREEAEFTAYDEQSIMNYPMAFKLENGVEKQISISTKLSFLDKYAIQKWYAK